MICPVCSYAIARSDMSDPGRTTVDCVHCGKFALSSTLVATLPFLRDQRDAAPKLSHVVRKAHETGQQLLLTSDIAEAILKNPLPRPREQADLLVEWLAINSPGLGESLKIDYQNLGAVVGARSHAGFSMLIEHLLATGLIAGRHNTHLSGGSVAHVALTFAGWDHYETLRLGGTTYRKAFMAMKFGDPTLNAMLHRVFKPAVKRAGFDLLKLDDMPKAGLIDDRMRVEIRASDFIIADLTHDNLGAYWEAGYAEGLGKPVIYTCERTKFDATKTHFDTNHHLTIVWDADAAEATGEQLTATIRATLPHLSRLTDA